MERVLQCHDTAMTSSLQQFVISQLTRKQRKLRRRHGTPAEFAVGVYKAVPSDISMDEARVAVAKYQLEWDSAGRVKP